MDRLEDARRRVRMVVLDVDGVLTDGHITFVAEPGRDPIEVKSFHVRDGLAVKWAGRVGLITGILTARSSPAVERRAREMDVAHLAMGVESKLPRLRALAADAGIPLDAVAYVGDDLADLGPLSSVGLPIAVADAAPEVREAALWVTERGGGAGAVREAIEGILRAQGRWHTVVDAHRGDA